MAGPATRSAPRVRRVVAVVFAAIIALLAPLAITQPAAAVTPTTCGFATPGTGLYSETICWIDLADYVPTEAASALGQEMRVAVPGGYTLRFTLRVSGADVQSVAFPTWPAAFLGSGSNFTNVPGRPALYNPNVGGTTTMTMTNISVVDSAQNLVFGYTLVGADAETTDPAERIVWSSTSPIQSLGGPTGLGNACGGTLQGLGSFSVTCEGVDFATKTGTAIVGTVAPTVFTQETTAEPGKQAVAFGLLMSAVTLNKAVVDRYPGDEFRLAVAGPNGNELQDQTTLNGTGTTGTVPVIAIQGPAPVGTTFTLSESAAGSTNLARYTQAWACTRNGGPDATLPTGTGTTKTVAVRAGDVVTCTVTNRTLPTVSIQKTGPATFQSNTPGDPGYFTVVTPGPDADLPGGGDVPAVRQGDPVTWAFAVTNTSLTLPLQGFTVTDQDAAGNPIAVECPPETLVAGYTLPAGGTFTCRATAVIAPTSP